MHRLYNNGASDCSLRIVEFCQNQTFEIAIARATKRWTLVKCARFTTYRRRQTEVTFANECTTRAA